MNERMNEEEPAMQLIDDGMLRAYLDGDPVLDDAARTQIAAALARQPALADRLAALRADVGAVDVAFAGFAAPEPDAAHLERAYRRVQTRLTTERHTSLIGSIKERFDAMTNYHRTARVRRYALVGGLGAVALAFLLIFAPVGDVLSAALNQFRYQPTKFAVITVKTSDFPQFAGNTTGAKPGAPKPVTGTKPAGSGTAQDQQKAMQELSKYVSVTSSITQGQLPGREVASAADAQKVTGHAVSAPSSPPPGVANTPHYYVSDKQTVDATLHLNEIRPALTAAGMASLIPATGDTATVHVDAPAASIVSYGFDPTAQGAAAQNQKGFAVIAMDAPTIDVNGLDIPGIVNVVSAMPGFPPDLAAQLKSADFAHTLIIPVTDQQTVKNGTINGAASTTISQKDGSMTAVLMSKNNRLYVVIGTADASTVEKVASTVSLN
jgi:hypothetical protein